MSTPAPLTSEFSAPKSRWNGFLLNPLDWMLVCGGLGLCPLMWIHSQNLSARPHLQFFPIAWAFLLALVYLRGSISKIPSRMRRLIAWFCFTAAFVVGAFASLKFSPWAAHVSLILLVQGWMLARLGGNSWTELVAWIGVFAITLPLPMNWDTLLIQRLQALSTSSANSLLDLTGTPHLATGNVLEIRTGKLFVDEACSGVDSLYSLFAIALILLVWQKRSFFSALVILGLVPFWAWLGNLIRIFLIAYLLDRYSIDLSHGTEHTLLGLCIFAASFSFVLLSQVSVDCLFEPFPVDNVTTNNFHRFYSRCVSWPGRSPLSKPFEVNKLEVPKLEQGNVGSWRILAVFAVVFSLGFATLGGLGMLSVLGVDLIQSQRFALPSWPTDTVSDVFSQDDLPENLHGARQRAFDISHRESSSILGEHSATWSYQIDGQALQISIDFPFSGFHGLEVCYQNAGKRLGQAIQSEAVKEGLFSANVHEARLIDELDQVSYLWYVNYDASGVDVTPLKSAVFGGGIANPPVAYQVQVYVPECGELSDSQRKIYQSILIHAARALLVEIQKLHGAT